MPEVSFHILGFTVGVQSDCGELLKRIRLDFSHFETPPAEAPASFQIICSLNEPDAPRPSFSIPTKNCRIHFFSDRKIFDYGGEGQVILKKQSAPALIHAASIDRLHELTYLLILSKAGKWLDQKGIHRIHGAAFSDGNRNYCLIAPMGTGKTTTLLNTLQSQPDLHYFSDDSPLMNKKDLELLPFPLRVGLKTESLPLYQKLAFIHWGKTYELKRLHYGSKTLIPVSAIARTIAAPSQLPLVFIKLKRSSEVASERPYQKVGRWHLFHHLFWECLIGRGLPIMREYFIEGKWSDLWVIPKILCSRGVLILKLVFKYSVFEGSVGSDPQRSQIDLKAFQKHS